MRVKLYYRTKDMEGKKMFRSSTITIKKAIEVSQELDKENKVEEAYLFRFDGWEYHTHKILKIRKGE